jgi:hypothetical protein
MPKTGGTTVANLLIADLCVLFDPTMDLFTDDGAQSFNPVCSKTCPMGNADTGLSCFPGASQQRDLILHGDWMVHANRAEDVKSRSGAAEVVWVTSLRRGSDRILSQWSHELNSERWQPPQGVEPLSSESLRAYLLNDRWLHDSFSESHDKASWRNNKQVSLLASVETGSVSHNNPMREVEEGDLELAKTVLRTGKWVVGFTDCLPKLHMKLEEIAIGIHGTGTAHKDMSGDMSHGTERQADVLKASLDPETLEILNNAAVWDNALYDWAQEQAGALGWAGPC